MQPIHLYKIHWHTNQDQYKKTKKKEWKNEKKDWGRETETERGREREDLRIKERYFDEENERGIVWRKGRERLFMLESLFEKKDVCVCLFWGEREREGEIRKLREVDDGREREKVKK